MGYTHYFDAKRNTPNSEWELAFPQIVADAKLIVAAAASHGIKIAGGQGDGEPTIGPDYIWLNGEGDESHETFVLKRGQVESWDTFCKTARKPYDAVVCAILIRAATHAPNSFAVQSDGRWDNEEWQTARKLVESIFAEPPAQILAR